MKRILAFFCLFSCVIADGSYPGYEREILLESKYHLSIIAGQATTIDTIGSYVKYMVSFSKVNGGATYLFGKKISEVNGHSYKRLQIFLDSVVIKEYSINDLKESLDSIIEVR